MIREVRFSFLRGDFGFVKLLLFFRRKKTK